MLQIAIYIPGQWSPTFLHQGSVGGGSFGVIQACYYAAADLTGGGASAVVTGSCKHRRAVTSLPAARLLLGGLVLLCDPEVGDPAL